ncbi:MAG: Fe-S cluster assembly ATPase SufC [Treponemataceae bacterium]|nr:Fe-S cluster assembly ATPase SufC [Treponemataceae bacterium]
MSDCLLDVQHISVRVDSKHVLRNLSMRIGRGETHVLMGPNGAGKSTLGNVLMGNPAYELEGGTILFDGADITDMPTDKRARAGLFMSFQNPLEVPGISVETFIRSAIQQRTGERVKLFQFQKELKAAMELLDMDASYAGRDLNVGFSGGERKKSEILQLLMLHPKFAVLDETDSGLDVDAVRTVSKGIEAYQRSHEGALLVITHSTRILESLHSDYTHILVNGSIVKTGDGSLVEEVNRHGFEQFLREGVHE